MLAHNCELGGLPESVHCGTPFYPSFVIEVVFCICFYKLDISIDYFFKQFFIAT